MYPYRGNLRDKEKVNYLEITIHITSKIFIGDKHLSKVFVSKTSTNTLRTPVTLGTLRSFKLSGCKLIPNYNL